MQIRRHHTQRVAAARSGLGERTGRRIERDPRLPTQKLVERPPLRQTVVSTPLEFSPEVPK
jgi:hypothetical protein